MLHKKINAEELRLDERELARRLMSDEGFDVYNSSEYKKLIAAADPSYVIKRVSLTRRDGGIYIEDIFTESKGFLQVAKDSEECFILACTLGIGVDKLISRESYISVTDAFTIDAVADAMVESLCDVAEREVCRDLKVSPRFSPGYSDLPLSVGKDMIRSLGADIRLGIKFTESEMMVPRKSVSAIICIKHQNKE